jgi:hypothetical protein
MIGNSAQAASDTCTLTPTSERGADGPLKQAHSQSALTVPVHLRTRLVLTWDRNRKWARFPIRTETVGLDRLGLGTCSGDGFRTVKLSNPLKLLVGQLDLGKVNQLISELTRYLANLIN